MPAYGSWQWEAVESDGACGRGSSSKHAAGSTRHHRQNIGGFKPATVKKRRSLRKVSWSFLFLLQHWLENLNDPKIVSRQAKFARFGCTRQGKSFVLTICFTQQDWTDWERKEEGEKGKPEQLSISLPLNVDLQNTITSRQVQCTSNVSAFGERRMPTSILWTQLMHLIRLLVCLGTKTLDWDAVCGRSSSNTDYEHRY